MQRVQRTIELSRWSERSDFRQFRTGLHRNQIITVRCAPGLKSQVYGECWSLENRSRPTRCYRQSTSWCLQTLRFTV